MSDDEDEELWDDDLEEAVLDHEKSIELEADSKSDHSGYKDERLALRMKLKEARQHLRALHHFKPYHKEMKTIHQDFKKYKKSHKDGVHLACYESVVMP